METYIEEVNIKDDEVEAEGEGHGQQQPDVALKRQDLKLPRSWSW